MRPYLLVKISDFVVQKLANVTGPSLYGRFGDYRGPVQQTIGIGDTIEVTVFEAAGGGLFSAARVHRQQHRRPFGADPASGRAAGRLHQRFRMPAAST